MGNISDSKTHKNSYFHMVVAYICTEVYQISKSNFRSDWVLIQRLKISNLFK